MTNHTERQYTPLLFALFFFSLIFHLIIGWQDISVLARNGFLCDDSFYAFQIAKNIATGLGPTFDGVQVTTGFQPLYVFLLVPVFFFFGSSLVLPIKIALALSALFTAVTAAILFLIIRRYTRESIAGLVAAIWAFSPVVIKQGANGLETSLALLFFALSVYYYLTRVRNAERPSRQSMLVLGILLGLAIFARVDELFLLLALLLDYLFVLRKRALYRGALTNVALLLVGVLVATSPWVFYYYQITGSPVLDSGSATRFLSIAYAPFFDIDTTANLSGNPSGSFLLFHVFHSLAVLKATPPVHVLYRLIDKTGAAAGAASAASLVGTVLGILLLSVLIYYFFSTRRQWKRNHRSEVNFLLVFSFLLMAAYSFLVFGFFFFIRYYYPVYFILCIYFAFMIEDCCAHYLPVRSVLIRRTVYGALTLYLIAFSCMAYCQSFNTKRVYCFYDVAKWAEKHTEKSDTIGAFQGGAIGYFSGRQVVNLDGKVNPQALDALKNGTLDSYIRQCGVTIVLDKSNVLDLFLLKRDGVDCGSLNLTRIEDREDPCLPGWVAYRVTQKGSAGGNSYPGVMRRKLSP